MNITLLINEQLATFEADTAQNLHKQLEELRVVDRAGQDKMTEMARTVMIVLSTGTANLAVF